ncbi:MAG: hypothetical protein H7067_09545, partial [Burkholderiales bacterium]|nr:hypothetical protein [Opitutaceae bacterium]
MRPSPTPRLLPALLFACVAAFSLALHAAPAPVPALAEDPTFAVVVYNVENLHDLDGVALYDDFKGNQYTPAHLRVKATNVATILAKIDKGAGPAIAMFNEIELDQTPDSTIADYDAWLASLADQPLEKLLSSPTVSPELAGVPAEAWLLKACVEAGLTGYHVAVTDERPGAGGAVRNVLFTRFPIKAVRSHPVEDARAILEVELEVNGQPLTVFVNHWKSMRGQEPKVTEGARRQNAGVLRDRINALLREDPNADILVGGDLNSHYNHKQRERDLGGKSGINDILGSQGNELAVRGKDRPLYNLWFELPSDQRASDEFDGSWGTLMHFIVSRGLYDQNGIQYLDNSFAVMKFPGLNVNALGLPNRFSRGKTPYGFSDHLPLYARFRVATEGARDKWIALVRPSETENGPADLVPA